MLRPSPPLRPGHDATPALVPPPPVPPPPRRRTRMRNHAPRRTSPGGEGGSASGRNGGETADEQRPPDPRSPARAAGSVTGNVDVGRSTLHRGQPDGPGGRGRPERPSHRGHDEAALGVPRCTTVTATPHLSHPASGAIAPVRERNGPAGASRDQAHCTRPTLPGRTGAGTRAGLRRPVARRDPSAPGPPRHSPDVHDEGLTGRAGHPCTPPVGRHGLHARRARRASCCRPPASSARRHDRSAPSAPRNPSGGCTEPEPGGAELEPATTGSTAPEERTAGIRRGEHGRDAGAVAAPLAAGLSPTRTRLLRDQRPGHPPDTRRGDQAGLVPAVAPGTVSVVPWPGPGRPHPGPPERSE